MLVVLDTNILVSAILTPAGKPGWLVNQVVMGNFKLCYDYRILEEYRDVLLRPKFHVTEAYLDFLLDNLTYDGVSVVPPSINEPFIDEDDKKFYEVAKFCNAPLITGNLRHYPKDSLVKSVSDFCSSFLM